jgi:hypothetical protein
VRLEEKEVHNNKKSQGDDNRLDDIEDEGANSFEN